MLLIIKQWETLYITTEVDNELLEKCQKECSKFIWRHPRHMRSDCLNQINSLIWEAYVKSCNCNAEGRFNYICFYVHRRLRSFVWNNKSFYINRSSCVRHNLESHRMDLDTVSPESKDETSFRELYETLISCCNDAIDQNIVSMRVYRYRNQEIISFLNLSESDFYRRLKGIIRRFKDALL